jgi:hypothetical protein
MTKARHIRDVNPNASEFRAALGRANSILSLTRLCAYSRHFHQELAPGEVVFGQRVAARELELAPVPQDEARQRGLPSCWGVAPDGTLVELRYASWDLHEGSGIDVTSAAFRAQLAEVADAFVVAGLHTVLEINVDGYLFPAGEGEVTVEYNEEHTRQQRVSVGPMPDRVAEGDWTNAACWGFSPQTGPFVTGICVGACPDRDAPAI